MDNLFIYLQPFVSTQARHTLGGEPRPPAFTQDVVALFQSRPDVLEYARAEIDRLSEHNGNRRLRDHDHESRMRADAIEQLIRTYEEASA